LANEAPEVSNLARATPVARLAKFFPQAIPLRLPVRLVREHDAPEETTTVEFGTANEVLFISNRAWEFAERLRLQNLDGSLDAEASVVAVQYYPGQTAVAARFTRQVSNWIVKP
jgi:hypothetical protein